MHRIGNVGKWRNHRSANNTEYNDMVAIGAVIDEVVSTLDQDLIETKSEPEETKDADLEETKYLGVSQPNMTTKTTKRVYNLRKDKNGNHGCDYSHRFGCHLMALVHISLTQLSMKSVMYKYKQEGCAEVTKDFLKIHT